MILEILYTTFFICATFFFVMRKEIIQRECQFILFIYSLYIKKPMFRLKIFEKCIRNAFAADLKTLCV